MPLKKDLIAYTLLTCLAFNAKSAELFGVSTTSTWTGAINTTWNSEGNWDNGTPGLMTTSTDTAIFSTAGVGTVSLDTVAISPGLNQLDLNTTGYTIDSSGTTNQLNFNLDGSIQPAINVTGTQTINAFSNINNTTLNVVLGDSSILTVQRDIQGTGTANIVVSGTGTGQMILKPAVANTGGIILTGSFTQTSGTFLNGANSNASGKVSVGAWTMNGGTYTSTNVSNVSGVGADNLSTTLITINSGTVSNINSANVNGANARGSRFAGTTGVVINGGTFISRNTGDISSGSGGTELFSGSSGTIAINGGTLNFTNSGAISNSASGCMLRSANQITITNGTINITNTVTDPKTVSGAAGVRIFTDANSLFFSGGTMNLTNNGTGTITSKGIFVNPAALLSLEGGTLYATNSGPISGGGNGITLQPGTGLNITSGTITLSNSGDIGNSNSRGILFSAGGVPVNITGGTISFGNSGTLANSGHGCRLLASSLTMSGGTFTLSNSGSVTQTSSFTAGNSIQSNSTLVMTGGTITLNRDTGGTLTGTTSGNLLIAATSISLDTGATLVNHGIVVTPTLTVGTAGIVAGTGVFTGSNGNPTTAFTNSGTFTLGDPGIGASNPGTATIQGGYTQSSTGTLVANILNTSTYSKLSVTGTTPGTATLAGNLQLSVLPGATINSSDVFTIVQTELANGVSGTLNLINNTPIFRANLTYLPNAVQVTLSPVAATSLNNSPSILLSTINDINTKTTRKAAQLRNRISDRTIGSPLASRPQDDFTSELIAFNEEIGQNNNPTLVQMRHVSFDEREASTPWKLYLGPTGNVGQVSSINNQPESDYWSAGALVGLDYAFSQGGLGSMINYNYIFNKTGSVGQAVANEIHINFYGTCFPKNIPQLGFNGIIGGSYEWYKTERNIPSTSLVAIGKPGGSEFDALVGLEYTFENQRMTLTDSRWRVTPLASLQYVYFKVDSYNEQQAGFYDLHVDEQTVNSLQTVLGSRFEYTWYPTSTQKYSAELDFAWQREFLRDDKFLSVSYVQFITPATPQLIPSANRNLFLAGINLSALYNGTYGWEASYDFQGNEDYLNHSFYLGFQSRF